MRDLKFRAWDNYNKRMIIEPFKITTFLNGVVELHTTNYLKRWDALMQYTGLKDKNGKEIYEGDIVKAVFNSSIHRVEWRNDQSQWSIGGFGQWEVIGNIYENPELLT